MKKSILIFSFLLMLGSITYAERINGPANIRTSPNGALIISLNDNVMVGCSELINGWYRVSISLKITKEQYESATPIVKGDSLYNWQNEFIGTALTEIPHNQQSTWYSGGAPGNPRRYGMEIYASTYKSNIKTESIPEYRLSAILSNTKNQTSRQDLSNFMTEFGFKNSGILSRIVKGYEEQMIYESTIDDPSPMDRIRFIFKGSELVAIVHTRPISKLLNSQTLTRGRNIIILKEMNQADLQKFLDINREAYAGID